MNKKENFTVIFIKFDKLIISNRRFGGRRATCAKLEGESSLRREGASVSLLPGLFFELGSRVELWIRKP